jgi:hypothetical protein
MMSVIICTLHQILVEWVTLGRWGRDENCLLKFWTESLKGREFERPRRYGIIILGWIHLAQHGDYWLAFVNTVTKLRFP